MVEQSAHNRSVQGSIPWVSIFATVNRNGSSVFYPIQKIIIRRTQAWRIDREEMQPVANRYTGNGAKVRVLHSPLSIVEGGNLYGKR